MKPEVLVMVPPQGYNMAGFDILQDDFVVHYSPDLPGGEKIVAEHGRNIRAVITTGQHGMSKAMIDAMPKLEYVQTRGMGFDRIDFEAAKARNIVVANSRAVNYFAVAEHAVALLLSLVRDIPTYNHEVHSGDYDKGRHRMGRPLVYGKKVGIFGLGDIGSAIAERVVGFKATVAYHNRNRRADVPYDYVGSLLELARQSDILMVAAPGGPETKHAVNAEVLDALGPKGFLVNVGRGTIVDNAALVAALKEDRIAGAALDVVEGEPKMPEEIVAAPKLIITPHVAANSPEARRASAENVLRNLKAHFAGEEITGRLA